MKHIEMGQSVDLVRGLRCRDRAELGAHLSVCRKCRQTVSTFRGFARIVQDEAEYAVPQYAVQSARAIYALQRPERVYFFPRLLGRLVYDSFREPLPAGLRARHRLTRHALYEAADYSLDLRLEHQIGTANVNLVGQIASQNDTPPANLPVFLVSGKEIVARTLTNAFGEFQIEYEPRQHMRLYLQPDQSQMKHIEVPLGRLSGKEARHRPKRSGRKLPDRKGAPNSDWTANR